MVKIVRGNACRKQITEDPCLKVTYEGHEFYVATKEELSTFFASLPLRRHVTLNNLQNCTVIASAVCNREGTLAFSAAKWEPSTARLSPDGEITVPSTTLDVCVYGEKRFRPPNVIKIDVEGAELEVLAGAARAICEFHPLMFLEIHGAELHRDCRDFLLARGYDTADAWGQLTASWKPTNS